MFYSPQMHPWTAVNLFGQGLVPGLSHLLQKKVGVQWENLICNWNNGVAFSQDSVAAFTALVGAESLVT